MFVCLVCGKRHYKGSIPAKWCHHPANDQYTNMLIMRHNQGFHAEGTGGHQHCPICLNPRPIQLRMF